MNKILRRILLGLGAVVVVLVLVALGLVLARDNIARNIITKAVTQRGFGLELKNLHIALSPPGLEVEGLKLTNPPDFPEAGALEINKLKVSYDRKQSTKEEVRLPEVTFDLPSLTIVRKADGEVNFQRFAKQDKGEKPATAEAPAPQPKPQPPPEPREKQPAKKVRIDNLNIRLGTVCIRTYAQGEKEPREQKLAMNVDKKFTNVTNDDFKKIGTQLMMEVLFKSSPDQLLDLGKDVAAKSGVDLKDAGNKLKGLFNSLKQQSQP
jgi:uncharacterized protein involved in outer membrane biogenesis